MQPYPFLVSRMMGFSTECDIAATPDRVWAVLMDGPGYPVWNPDVAAVEGTIADGERIVVRSLADEHVFRARVIAPGRQGRVRFRFDPPVTDPHGGSRSAGGDSMVWRGGIPLGLLSRVRAFTVSPTDAGTSLLIEEWVSGPLLSVARVRDRLQKSGWHFLEWADSLKRIVET